MTNLVTRPLTDDELAATQFRTREVITDTEEGVVHGIDVAAWEGGKRDTLLSGSFLGVFALQFDGVRWNRTPIVKGVDLRIDANEKHAIMGPNGSGKSTLARVLSGHPGYEPNGGTVTLRCLPLSGNRLR